MDYITQHHHTMQTEPFDNLNGAVVLLVDPESESRNFYGHQLEDIGMKVLELESLAKMVAATKTHSPDVVIVNPSPDYNAGSKQIQSLREQFPVLPVITMTTTIPDDVIDAMMKAGVSLHINRGLTQPRDLLLALEQVIRAN